LLPDDVRIAFFEIDGAADAPVVDGTGSIFATVGV
jgi:hypothetical protein